VVDAAQALFFVTAEEQRRAAVGTVGVDEADLALCVAEGNEVLAHDADAHRDAVWAGQLLGQGDGEPEATEELTHRRTGVGVGNELVVFLRQHDWFTPNRGHPGPR
jgi:hypothetical protein